MKLTAVIYPFVPHYRRAIMQRLVDCTSEKFQMVCGREDPVDHIPVWLPESAEFVETKTYNLPGRWFWQTNLFRVAVSPRYSTLIFRGNVYCGSTWYAALLGRLTGKTIIFWGHGWIREDHGIKKWMRQLFYRLPHKFLYYGNFGKEIGIQMGFPRDEAHVVYNNQELPASTEVPTEETRRLKAELFARPHQPTVICTGRLHPRKNLHHLIEAAAALQETHPINLLIVGDGDDKERLTHLAQQYNVDAHFYGACYDESTLGRLYNCATLSVCPSAVGLTAIHSMTYGVPILTNDDYKKHGPEYEAIMPGLTGDFFSAGDVGQLTAFIRDWTENEFPSEAIKSHCQQIVSRLYNAEFQEQVILRAVAGKKADDIWWFRDPVYEPAFPRGVDLAK